MSLIAYFGLPLDVQIMLALVVLVLLARPVASIRRNVLRLARGGRV